MSVSVLAFIGVVVAGATGAFFTDTETNPGNTFTSGTLKIGANNTSEGTFSFNIGDVSGLAPGDHTGPITLTVQNQGSLDAATFGKFELSGDLAGVLKLHSYRVQYYHADGTPKNRWATEDPYYGSAANEDWFIKDGTAHPQFIISGGSNLLSKWSITGNGALDVNDSAWDFEGLRPGEYYTITFELGLDENAGDWYQGKSGVVGYVVKATQINKQALLGLNISADFNTNVDSHLTYLQSQTN